MTTFILYYDILKVIFTFLNLGSIIDVCKVSKLFLEAATSPEVYNVIIKRHKFFRRNTIDQYLSFFRGSIIRMYYYFINQNRNVSAINDYFKYIELRNPNGLENRGCRVTIPFLRETVLQLLLKIHEPTLLHMHPADTEEYIIAEPIFLAALICIQILRNKKIILHCSVNRIRDKALKYYIESVSECFYGDSETTKMWLGDGKWKTHGVRNLKTKSRIDAIDAHTSHLSYKGDVIFLSPQKLFVATLNSQEPPLEKIKAIICEDDRPTEKSKELMSYFKPPESSNVVIGSIRDLDSFRCIVNIIKHGRKRKREEDFVKEGLKHAK